MSTSENQKEYWHEMEPNQLQNIFHEDDVPLLSIVRDRVNVLLGIGIGLFVTMFISGFIVTVPREINVNFELNGGGSEKNLQFTQSIQIKERHVAMGDEVRINDPLLTIYSDDIAEKISQYQHAANHIRNFKDFSQPRYELEQKARRQEVEMLTSNIASLKRELLQLELNQENSLSEFKSLVKIASSQYARDLQLHKSGTIALLALEQSEQNLRQAKSSLNTAAAEYSFQLSTLVSTLREYESQRDKLNSLVITAQASNIEEQSKLEVALSKAGTSISALYGPFRINESSLVLLSSDNGVVTLLNGSENALLPGTVVCKIRKGVGNFFATSIADPKQAGSLKNGQKVILKFASFPHYYYGTLVGKIEAISQTADSNGGFPLVISLEEKASPLDKLISNGMQGTASIVVEEYSIMQYLFRKLLQTVSW